MHTVRAATRNAIASSFSSTSHLRLAANMTRKAGKDIAQTTAATRTFTISSDSQPWENLQGRLHDGLIRGVRQGMGYEVMSPVQQKVLTELPSYDADCLVQAKTGTGKTLAYLLPALHTLLNRQALPRGQVAILIVSPTRELAQQIAKECDSVTTGSGLKLECHPAFGGTSKEKDLHKFAAGDPKIVVATPGRLNDILTEDTIARRFANLQTLVLDEADQMLETGFLPDVERILRRLPPKSQAAWQGMCYSATMPQKILGVLPKVLRQGYTHLSTVDPDEVPTIDAVTQHSMIVPDEVHVFPTLWALLLTEYEASPDNFKAIVFGTTARGVALMHDLFANLTADKSIQVFQLQSRLTQAFRTRTAEQFKAAPAGVMFASDVIGRGLDFPNVTHVLQVGLPMNEEQYIHRIGRTARAGKEGRGTILLTQRESFFLRNARGLPITPYPINLSSRATVVTPEVQSALHSVDLQAKEQAYRAWLGYNKGFLKKMQYTNETLVQDANNYAFAMGCPEVPMIEPKTVGKMGLKGTQGLNIGIKDQSGSQSQRPRSQSAAGQSNGRVDKQQRGGGGEGRGGRGGRGRGRGRGGAAGRGRVRGDRGGVQTGGNAF